MSFREGGARNPLATEQDSFSDRDTGALCSTVGGGNQNVSPKLEPNSTTKPLQKRTQLLRRETMPMSMDSQLGNVAIVTAGRRYPATGCLKIVGLS
jgi:hypothetical protein